MASMAFASSSLTCHRCECVDKSSLAWSRGQCAARLYFQTYFLMAFGRSGQRMGWFVQGFVLADLEADAI